MLVREVGGAEISILMVCAIIYHIFAIIPTSNNTLNTITVFSWVGNRPAAALIRHCFPNMTFLVSRLVVKDSLLYSSLLIQQIFIVSPNFYLSRSFPPSCIRVRGFRHFHHPLVTANSLMFRALTFYFSNSHIPNKLIGARSINLRILHYKLTNFSSLV